MEVNLVWEGIKFMFLGMTTVLLFLVLMIVTMSYMSKIIQKYFPEPQGAVETGSSSTQNADKTKKIAAITAAILHHKKIGN
jgi:oxaloacetate decarboxylase gamma subunit